jgi:two-component system response regulator AtoC
MDDLDWTRFDVLVVDDEQDNLDALRFTFRKAFRLSYAIGADQAWERLETIRPAVVLADQRMPKTSGVELLGAIKKRYPDCYAVLLTAYADMDVLVDAVNSGAVDRYVQKPWDSDELGSIVRQGIRAWATLSENRRLRDQLRAYTGYLEGQQRDPIDFGSIVGQGEATQALLERVADVAPTMTPVLIGGEPGSDKEVVARAIHVSSPRESRPFVRVTCAAFAGEALERELFGWKRGAFEGALSDRTGRLELADRGTVYLHELSELTPALAARLLRLLVEGTTERLAETESRPIDVRLVVSTVGTARQFGAHGIGELSSRLSVFPIVLTALRDRPEDVGDLTEHFLRRYAARNAGAATAISAQALRELASYAWPGGERELQNVVERAAILAKGETIDVSHLLFQGDAGGENRKPAAEVTPGISLSRRLDAIERRELVEALEAHHGNKAEVARALGIHRTTLYYRIKKLGIDA